MDLHDEEKSGAFKTLYKTICASVDALSRELVPYKATDLAARKRAQGLVLCQVWKPSPIEQGANALQRIRLGSEQQRTRAQSLCAGLDHQLSKKLTPCNASALAARRESAWSWSTPYVDRFVLSAFCYNFWGCMCTSVWQ